MIATFYYWSNIENKYVLAVTCIVGSAQYNTAIGKLCRKYEKGYIKCNGQTIFRWKWTA